MKIIPQYLLAALLGLACLPVMAADGQTYVAPSLKHPAYGDTKIVVPITSTDQNVWKMKLGNIMNAQAAVESYGGKLTVKVVSYSGGVKLLQQKDNEIAEMVDALRKSGVQFLVCNQTLKRMDMDYHALNNVKDEDVVPAGFLEVGWLQTQHFVADPIN